MVSHNAERLEIYLKEGLASSSDIGYRMLGLPSLEMIRKKDHLRKQKKLSTSFIKSVYVDIERCKIYGWNPEAWKRWWILFHKKPSEMTAEHLEEWYNLFQKTEYKSSDRSKHLYDQWKILNQNIGENIARKIIGK